MFGIKWSLKKKKKKKRSERVLSRLGIYATSLRGFAELNSATPYQVMTWFSRMVLSLDKAVEVQFESAQQLIALDDDETSKN